MQKLSRRRKKSRGVAIKTGGHYSNDLIQSINNRVDAITKQHLAPPIPSLTTDQLLKKLNDRVSSMSTKSNDQLRQLQRIFGGGTNKELNVQEFKNKVAKLGVGLTDKQCSNLFTKIDTDNSGGISVKEFVYGIMPKEMTIEPWYEKRRQQMTKEDGKNRQTRGSIDTSMFRQKVAKNVPARKPKEICQLAYARIVSLSKRPTDQLRRIRRIFALSADDAKNPSGATNGNELTPDGLRRQLAKIEILLKDEEVVPLFSHLDCDNSGTIDMQEFLTGVMPRDITRENVWDKREKDRQNKIKEQKLKARKNIQYAAENFRTDARPELDVPSIKKVLLEKINQLAKKPTDRVRKVSQIFKRGSGNSTSSSDSLIDGVNVATFKSNIEKLGLTLTNEQAQLLFNDIDDDNSGSVSLHEFLNGLLPIDYTGESWHEKSQREKLKIEKSKKDNVVKQGKSGFHSGAQPNMTKDDIINEIRMKMEMFSTKPSDAFRQITRIFGSSGDCTLKTFQNHISKLRIYLTDQQAIDIFNHFDKDNSGSVSIVEFITGVQQHEAKNISMFSKRQLENEHHEENRSVINRDFFRPKPRRNATRSVQELKSIIMTKIEQKSSKPSDQIRQVRRLFAQTRPDDYSAKRTKNGLGPNDMAEALRALGVILNDKEINALFEHFDTDQSGDLSMQELISGCLPKHFTNKPWWEKSRERQNILDKISKENERSLRHENRFTHPELNVDDLIQVIRVKVESHASKASDTVRQMLVRFKQSNELKVEVDTKSFHDQVKHLGVIMTAAQSKGVFEKLDRDQSGTVDIIEFLSGMGNDYSGTTYFETRPSSRIGKSEHHRLGGTKFNRRGAMEGCSMRLREKQEVSKYTSYVPGYEELIVQRAKEKETLVRERLENEKAKFLRDSIQRKIEGIPTPTPPRATDKSNKNDVDEPETTNSMLQQTKLPNVRTSPRQKGNGSPRMLSPRQQQKLKQMLQRSMGDVDDGVRNARFSLRPVHTMLDIKSGKATSFRGKTPQNARTKVPFSSPRSWTQVLRGGDERHVWKDTGDSEMTYETRFQGRSPRSTLNHMGQNSPRPPVAPSTTRERGLMRNSPRVTNFRSPRYRKHRDTR